MRLSVKAGLLAFLGTLAAVAAFMFPGVPASAATAEASAPSASTAASACDVGTGLGGVADSEFDRCTSTGANGVWAGTACNPNANFNANGTNAFNVYETINNCVERVWLHEIKNWSQGGWSYCVNPSHNAAFTPPQFVNPLNIYISNVAARCP